MKSSPALSEEALKVFQALPDLYLILSVDLVILTASDAFLKATFTKREQITGKFVFDVFPDNPVATGVHAVRNLATSFRQVLATKQPHQLPSQQYDVPLPGKEAGFVKKYWLPLSTPVLDEFGDIHYIIHRVEDVTEQTLQEVHSKEALQQSEDLFHAVLDSSLDMIQVFESVRNGQGEIVDFVWKINNKTSQHIYGDVIGKRLLELNPGVNAIGIFDTFKQVVDTGIADQSERYYVYEQFDGWFYQSTVKFGDGVATTTTNITKLKQAECNLQIANERLQAVLDSSLYVIQAFEAVRDQTGKIVDFSWVFTNQRWKQLYGDEMLGKKVLQENPGVVQSGLFDKFIQVTETGVSIDHEQYYAYEQFDGWFHQTLVKMGDGFVMNTEDITRRKQIEQELKESRDLVQTVFDVVLNPIAYHTAVRDASGEIIDFEFLLENREARKYAVEHRTGKRYSEAYPGIKNTSVFRLYCQVVETGNPLDTEVQLTLKGTEYWFHLMAARLGDGLVATAVDITERKITEAEIIRLKEEIAQKATDKYQALFNSIDEGFAIQELLTDNQGNVTDLIYREVNESFEQHTGMKNALGRKVSEFVPHLEQHWLDALTQVYHTGRPLRNEGYTADLNRWLTYQYSRIGGAGSRLIAVVFNDITERKQREQQQTFLIKFSDALRAEPDADALANRAIQMLAEQLQLDRCYVGIALLADDRGIFPYQTGNDRVLPMPEGGVRLSDFSEALRKTFDQTLVITDFQNTEGLTETEKQNFGALGFGALVVANVRKEERNPYWSINAVSAIPRRWTSLEIQLIEEVTERTWAAVERAKAEQALQKSEEKYRTLFNSIDQGFSVIELIFDENGKVSDYRHIEHNPVFTRMTGLKNVIGKRMSELLAYVEPEWHQMIEDIYYTGEPIRIEYPVKELGKWFNAYMSQVGGKDSPLIVCVYDDITERKQREKHQEFLFFLSDTIRALTDEQSIKEQTVRMLGEYLDADRCYISEVFEQQGFSTVGPEHLRQGIPSMAGVFRLADYPETMRELTTQPLIIDDADNDPRFSDLQKAMLAKVPQRALLVTPLRKGPHGVIWAIAAAMAIPRHWTDGEQRLLADVAERTWAAIERTKAEEALRESQKRLQSITNLVPDLLWDSEPDGSTNWYNQRWLEYTGQNLEQAIGWGWTDAIHPDDREGSARRYGDTFETGKPLRQEHRIRRHDGEYRWFVVSAWPLKDSSGQVVKIYGAATDIHDRKQAEDALRESEERKAFLLKLSDALHPLYDPIEIEHTANKVAMDYFGSDRCYYCQIKGGQAIIYRDAAREGLPSVANVYPLHTMPIFKTVIDVAKPFIVPDVKVTELVDESLRELCVSLQVISFMNIPVIKDNNPVGILCIVQSTPRNWTNFEVSLAEEVAERIWTAVERARAEANLRENEEQFRRALEEAPIPIIMHAEDGEVLQISRSWTELTGYSLQEVPSFEFWLTKAYGQGADQVRSHMQHLFEGHVRTLNIDFPILTRHGQLRHWSFSASSPGVLRDGRRFIVGMAVDITERLQAQMQLQEFNTMLERQVSERTKELEESRDLLQSVFDTSLMGMSVMKAVRDENGNILDFRIRIANKEIKRETGRIDLEGKLYAKEFPGIQQVGIFDIMLRVMETGNAEGMEYYYPFEGFNKWFTCMFVKLEDGVVATNLDITERKLVELELHKRLMILQQAEQVAAMGSWEYDLETKSFYWSEGMYRLFGLPLGSQIHLEVYLDYVDRQDHPLAQKMVDKIRNGEGPFEETLHMIVDQKPVTVKVKSAVMYDTEGKPMRVVGVDLDISELKRLEEENIKIRVEQQNQLLLAILDAQEEERRRISESLHNGVGQILYATKLNLNQLELYLESNDKPMVQKSLRATEAMLVDAIAETRRASHELVPILLKEYGLDKAIKDFCTRFSGSGIEFACHGLEERFPYYLEAAIYRIAQELANNIVKHSGATRARIEVTHDNQFIYVEAQDNGKGIQTPKPDSSKSGKGIGMKTIEDRVKLLEGTIEIESAPGKGTLITIILPRR
ncbi:PAS domain S-box protein [Cytophagaceae bacterium DM2B3-1]|uniref:Oxygen sensor histidine kinase NreB n=1 Tax=Xanthocytophaga flava TaxID=3048013 RepID=A0ABT7CUR1_9BACT|nr:PAS domain S-box protein [Xanthocytophaga flavus]MDJ1497492.1 PAS domain S-box protein [Xanthocytophaga flavus]